MSEGVREWGIEMCVYVYAYESASVQVSEWVSGEVCYVVTNAYIHSYVWCGVVVV